MICLLQHGVKAIRRAAALLCGCALCLWQLPVQAQDEVIYPAFESRNDPRYADVLELLRTALDKTAKEYGPYRLRPSTLRMNHARALEELRTGRLVNVVSSPTSTEKEQSYIPIRIPLRKGLLGYRLLLIHEDSQEKLREVREVADLRTLRVGQGLGWGDIAIYAANGIPVNTGNYEALFSMLDLGRFDIFPRGIGEIFREYDKVALSHRHLRVDDTLVLHYPWPYYFFVSKSTPWLAERIEKGLRQMLRDGSLDAIFFKYNADMIRRARLHERRMIQLVNPFLPKETPLHDSRLWYDPMRTPAPRRAQEH